MLVLLWIVFSNFHESHSYILIEKHLLVKVSMFINRVLFLFWSAVFFQIFMNHNKNNMWFIKWDTFMTLWKFTIEIWPHSLTSGYPQSRVPLRPGKAVYVRWGFEVGSNTCLATSWCTRKDLRDTSLYCYCCMVYKKKELWQKKSWLGRNTKYTKTNL